MKNDANMVPLKTRLKNYLKKEYTLESFIDKFFESGLVLIYLVFDIALLIIAVVCFSKNGLQDVQAWLSLSAFILLTVPLIIIAKKVKKKVKENRITLDREIEEQIEDIKPIFKDAKAVIKRKSSLKERAFKKIIRRKRSQ